MIASLSVSVSSEIASSRSTNQSGISSFDISLEGVRFFNHSGASISSWLRAESRSLSVSPFNPGQSLSPSVAAAGVSSNHDLAAASPISPVVSWVSVFWSASTSSGGANACNQSGISASDISGKVVVSSSVEASISWASSPSTVECQPASFNQSGNNSSVSWA